jgi:hypothetical protein
LILNWNEFSGTIVSFRENTDAKRVLVIAMSHLPACAGCRYANASALTEECRPQGTDATLDESIVIFARFFKKTIKIRFAEPDLRLWLAEATVNQRMALMAAVALQRDPNPVPRRLPQRNEWRLPETEVHS